MSTVNNFQKVPEATEAQKNYLNALIIKHDCEDSFLNYIEKEFKKRYHSARIGIENLNRSEASKAITFLKEFES